MRRDNFRQSQLVGRFSPRPDIDLVRQFRMGFNFDYTLTADTSRLEDA